MTTRARARRAAGLVVILVVSLLIACEPETAPEPAYPSSPFEEPVRLSSEGGVLEVTLTAHQAVIDLNTVDSPVRNALVFGYELLQGSSSSGKVAEDVNYPGPSLHVEPGETLIVHLANDLQGLTIPDFYDPAFTAKGEPVPMYPPALKEAPFNLHTHGLHVSPAGNSDNVLLDVPPGYTNTYTYRISDDMPQGLYWYHGHRHTLTAQQTYLGLSGLIEIGDPSGGIPLVEEHDLPVRTMALQYNYVFDRAGGSAQLNDPNWPQYLSTLKEPTAEQLADGSYEPDLAPVNFATTPKGTQALTNWYAGKLSIDNDRGRFQFIPSNLLAFTEDASPGTNPVTEKADLAMPDEDRDVQFTVNGDFQPALRAAPGQTEIWVLANTSDFAYLRLRLTETATDTHPPIAVVGQDGNPYTEVHLAPEAEGTQLVIPPGSRYAIAVTMPDEGELVLEMPPMPGSKDVSGPGVRYTNDGTEHPPAVLGTIDISAAAISYFDGFFLFPTQELLRMEPAPSGEHVATPVPFVEGQALDAYTSFVETKGIEPDVRRRLVISGGFDDEFASMEDPKAFTYQFDGNIFPYVPLLQPRVGSVEEWTIVNRNNDEHPIHIHVNDFQVTELIDPVAGTSQRFLPWGQDNANTPAPLYDAKGNVVAPGLLSVRTLFDRYTGTYVMHCHRLNHEDNGLMALVNVIPARSTYAVASPGKGSEAASVVIRDGAHDQVVAKVIPFAGVRGMPSVAMGDVDGDQVLDLIAGAPAGGEVVAYSGAAGSGAGAIARSDGGAGSGSDPGAAPFTQELARFAAFGGEVPGEVPGGVRVAAADIDGNGLADNIIAAPGPGSASEVRVFGSTLPPLGQSPTLFTTYSPYGQDTHGTELAAGLVNLGSGRASIVTAPGPGTEAVIKVATFDLFTPNGEAPTREATPGSLMYAEEFTPFPGYTGGVSLATGWVAGELGGAERIVIGQAAGDGAIKVYSTGSALDGHPTMYLESPNAHSMAPFQEMTSFVPAAVWPGGDVRVATTATTTGADLLVTTPEAGGGSFTAKYRLEVGPGGKLVPRDASI